MKIHIRQIGPEAVEREEEYSAEWVGLTRHDSVRLIEPLDVKARITRVDNEVFAKVTAGSRYESLCYRCLESVKRDWVADFKLIFDIEKKTEFIELDEDIRQELILNLPPRVLCQVDCKGLCIDCGINLNKEQCQHQHEVSVVSRKS